MILIEWVLPTLNDTLACWNPRFSTMYLIHDKDTNLFIFYTYSQSGWLHLFTVALTFLPHTRSRKWVRSSSELKMLYVKNKLMCLSCSRGKQF